MTKEELRKEATTTVEWECTPMIERPIFVHAYITGAEPREKRIAELEAQIERNKIDLAISEHDREHDDYEFTEVYTKVEQLEKENAELKEKLETTEKTRDYWKDSSFDWRHKCTSRKPFRAAVKAQRQLTKAKRIIGNLVDLLTVLGIEDMNIAKEAVQYLKEAQG